MLHGCWDGLKLVNLKRLLENTVANWTALCAFTLGWQPRNAANEGTVFSVDHSHAPESSTVVGAASCH